MRYFLDISYLGPAFHGWQIQQNAHSVQAAVNSALSTLFQEKIACTGSGRTDTGVHAIRQVAHFDTHQKMDSSRALQRLNSLLPHEISINSIRRVKDDAHARHDAMLRRYQYHIHRYKDPFKNGRSYCFRSTLDLAAIQDGMRLIHSWKNFRAFSKVHTQVKHFECEIYDISWEETNAEHLFSVSANRFLRGMVRAMVGTLLQMGQGKLTLTGLEAILRSGDRSLAGRAVPAEGLYLVEVQYPNSVYIAD